METHLTIPQENEHQLPAVVDDKPKEMAIADTPLTPAQARVDAVSNVLHKAYERASTLELTPEQVKALKADFPNEAFKLGAGGNPDLIYIEHAYLRDRFDEVLGMGQWALVRSRPHWGEDYTTSKGQKAVRIYADCALLIKGCLVAEAIGEMSYFPNNATQNYGDAAEGSETAAFRRCAKKLGVGLQAWKKDFCANWMAQHSKGSRQPPKPSPAPAPAAPKPATAPVRPAQQAPSVPADASKADLLAIIRKHLPQGMEEWLVGFLRTETDKDNVTWLMPNETLEDLSDEKLTILAKSPTKMLGRLQAWVDAQGNTPVDEQEKSEDESWRMFIVPFGKNKGTPLGELPKNTLFGFWANYTVETEYQGKPKKPETIAQDQAFRDALDAAGKHYEFTKDHE